jgi:hypothetical protein
MRKEMYIIRGTAKENHTDFKKRILSLGYEVARETKPATLRLTVTEAPRPSISIIPFKKSKIAVISVYKDSEAPVSKLIHAEGFAGAYTVEEAIPVGYKKTWKNGEPSPGTCLLTLFHQKPGIGYEAFIDRWHNSHTPLSLKLHPLWNYNRNVVKEKISDHADWYDGIVEEQTRTRSELLNPFKFFGKPHKIIQNMMAVYTDTNAFLDYKRIETYLVAEYQLV